MKRFITVMLSALLLVGGLTSCRLTVPRPEIKQGEFDFSVTYEWAGKTHTVSGVYVCEYNGNDWAPDGGYYRDWIGYIRGGEMEDVIYIDTTEDGDEIFLVLSLYPDYFMGDYSVELYGVPAPYIQIKDYDEEGLRIIHDPTMVEEICGAKIVSYEYDEPIENAFGLFK